MDSVIASDSKTDSNTLILDKDGLVISGNSLWPFFTDLASQHFYQQMQQESEEGCLSVPGYVGLVDRPEKIVIKGLDREGNPQEFALEGFPAIVMCHEYDHLDGILYKDKAKEMYELTDAADTTEE